MSIVGKKGFNQFTTESQNSLDIGQCMYTVDAQGIPLKLDKVYLQRWIGSSHFVESFVCIKNSIKNLPMELLSTFETSEALLWTR